jgi:hypothetical protein
LLPDEDAAKPFPSARPRVLTALPGFWHHPCIISYVTRNNVWQEATPCPSRRNLLNPQARKPSANHDPSPRKRPSLPRERPSALKRFILLALAESPGPSAQARYQTHSPEEVLYVHSKKITEIGQWKKAKSSIRRPQNPEQGSSGVEDHQPEADKCIPARSLLTTFPANAQAAGDHNRRPFLGFFRRALGLILLRHPA